MTTQATTRVLNLENPPIQNLVATGGSIDNTVFGKLQPSVGDFTSLDIQGVATIVGGTIDGTPIGATTPNVGYFTNLTVTGTFIGGVNTKYHYQLLTSGTSWTSDSGIKSNGTTVHKFTLIGGGAGGAYSQTNYGGGGGGAGGLCIYITNGIKPSTTYSMTIGTGSASVTPSSSGVAGGTTSITLPNTAATGSIVISANGGSYPTSVYGLGGVGGTTGNGIINILGAYGIGGNYSLAESTNGGAGGSTIFGAGGAGGGGIAGFAATGYGAGGGGGGNTLGTTVNAGGNGANGCILVEWWA